MYRICIIKLMSVWFQRMHVYTYLLWYFSLGFCLGGSIYASEYVLNQASFKNYGVRVMTSTTGLIGETAVS